MLCYEERITISTPEKTRTPTTMAASYSAQPKTPARRRRGTGSIVLSTPENPLGVHVNDGIAISTPDFPPTPTAMAEPKFPQTPSAMSALYSAHPKTHRRRQKHCSKHTLYGQKHQRYSIESARNANRLA